MGRLVIICLRMLFAGADYRAKLHRRLDLFRRRVGMSRALVRFAFLSILMSVPNLALADEKGAVAGAIT